MSEPTSSASKSSVLENPDEKSRGHIGLIVLGSILGGLVLGLILVLGVFAGAYLGRFGAGGGESDADHAGPVLG